jgi:hypothetical protein
VELLPPLHQLVFFFCCMQLSISLLQLPCHLWAIDQGIISYPWYYWLVS